MRNAIILHGRPSKEEYYDPKALSQSNQHWLPWLQAELMRKDISAATPEVPHSFDCDWPVWIKEFERFDITPETILIGHSTGGGLIVKYLSIHPEVKVGKVVLVAPWLDTDNELTTDFFKNFEIDPEMVSRTAGVTIFKSDDDTANIHDSAQLLREKVKGIKYREFHNYGHFIFEHMHTAEFPELLEEVLS